MHLRARDTVAPYVTLDGSIIRELCHPAAVPVRITADVVGGRVEVRVVDRGPGISEARKADVFQPFQHFGDRNGNGHPGLGLGLAIAKGFVEAMGGEVTIEDTPGGGATLVVSLRQAAA